MANPVVHFEIGGPDHEGLKAFYEGVFGWEVHDMPEAGYSLIHTKDGDHGIDGGMPVHDTPWVCVYIEVAEPQASLDAAFAAGAEVIMPVQGAPGVTLAMFKDPAGNQIGIVKAEESASA